MPPDELKLMVAPSQLVPELVTLTVGVALTVTVWLAVAVQPVALIVAVTVYVVLADGAPKAVLLIMLLFQL